MSAKSSHRFAFAVLRRRSMLSIMPWLLAGCGGGGADNSESTTVMAGSDVGLDGLAAKASYRLTLSTLWDAKSFPTQFPVNRHFSGLVGATHDDSVSIWQPGGTASLGVKNMAELGQKSALLDEVAIAQRAGGADQALSGGGISADQAQVTLDVTLTQRHPLLTLVSMVAPSPDWFVGVTGLSLQKNGRWLSKLAVSLEVYDAGTDSGRSFASADQISTPRMPIQVLTTDPADTDFAMGVHRNNGSPLASLLIERLV